MTTATPVSDATMDALLPEVVRRLERAFSPERVILFGSYAEGRPTPDSDLDLLVITRQRLGWRERHSRTRGLFRDMPLPIQVVTISRDEFERTHDVIGGVAYPAAKYGRVLYERP
jgi:predicted nucleotidyltransferase